MTKLTLVLLGVLLSINSFASGKLFIQGNKNFQTETYQKYSIPLVGLAIYEPIFKGKMAYNSYMGYGKQDFVSGLKEDVNYAVVKSDIDFMFGRLTLSTGVTVKYIMPYKEMANDVHVRAAFRLWD